MVESGPVDYDEHDQEYINMDDEDEEDVHLSAAQLMGQEFGQGKQLMELPIPTPKSE